MRYYYKASYAQNTITIIVQFIGSRLPYLVGRNVLAEYRRYPHLVLFRKLVWDQYHKLAIVLVEWAADFHIVE